MKTQGHPSSEEEIHASKLSVYTLLQVPLARILAPKMPAPLEDFIPPSAEVWGNLFSLDVHSPFTTTGPGVTRINLFVLNHHENPRSYQFVLISWDPNPHTVVHDVFHLSFQTLCLLRLIQWVLRHSISVKSKICSRKTTFIWQFFTVCEISLCFLIQRKVQINPNGTASPAAKLVTIFPLTLFTPLG